MRVHSRVVLLLTAILTISPAAYSAWGDFDTTFGFLGVSIDGVTNHYPADIAIQPDGKILVTGYRVVGGNSRFFLRRYLSNGQLDTSFGTNGSAVPGGFIITNADYMGKQIAVQANGRIAVLGTGNQVPTVWRFSASGAPDTSMGTGGWTTIPGYQCNYACNIATYANILYVGFARGDYTSGVVVKFNSSGSRDMTFGTNGEMIPGSFMYYKMSTEPGSGNILIGGKKQTSSYGIERFLPTGVLDPTFDHYDTTYQGAPGLYPSTFIRLSHGAFVLNEKWYPITTFPPVTTGSNLVRFSSSGNYLGRTTYVPAMENQNLNPGSCPEILGQQSDGRVVAKGVHGDKLYRFSTNFSTWTTMTCGSYASFEGKTAALLQADDKMVAAGRYSGNIAIVRTLP